MTLVALAIIFIGLGLVVWSITNPRWRYGAAQGATLPFIGGILLVTFGAILTAVQAFIGG